jgi:CDP-glucose 4,6-dehydratase
MRNAKYTRMQNVFITGGAGLVGGHVISEVFRVNPQADVTVLVQSMDPRSFFVSSGLNDRVRIVFGDVRDERTVRDGVFNFEADTIFHLAAQPLVNVALVNPRQTWDTNLMGTVNVMEAARTSANVKAVVVASSDKAYGAAKFQPYTEDHPLEGLHPYDTSKSCVDLIARSYAVCYGVPVVVTRFGNIFGPGDLNFNRLVPGAMMALATGRELLIRSDGTLTRDFVYVKDVAKVYVMLARRAAEHAGQAFNCTSGVNMSVSDMLGFIGRTLNRPVPHRILNEMRHEIPVQSLSDRKLRDAFGWTPAFTPGHAVRETWEWYEKLFR